MSIQKLADFHKQASQKTNYVISSKCLYLVPSVGIEPTQAI